MSQKIQIRRGNITNIPSLDTGELGLAQDTKDVYIGTPTGNLLVGGKSVDDKIGDLSKNKVDKTDLAKLIPVDIPQEPFVIAHRGGAFVYPENTMVAYRNIYSAGIRVLEPDVQTLAYGSPGFHSHLLCLMLVVGSLNVPHSPILIPLVHLLTLALL